MRKYYGFRYSAKTRSLYFTDGYVCYRFRNGTISKTCTYPYRLPILSEEEARKLIVTNSILEELIT